MLLLLLWLVACALPAAGEGWPGGVGWGGGGGGGFESNTT